jgi:hypothetical protein
MSLLLIVFEWLNDLLKVIAALALARWWGWL